MNAITYDEIDRIEREKKLVEFSRRYARHLEAEASELAEQKRRHWLRTHGPSVRHRVVVLMPAGEYFAHAVELAKFLGLGRSTIRESLRRRGRLQDGRWVEYADEPPRAPPPIRTVMIERVSDGEVFISITSVAGSTGNFRDDHRAWAELDRCMRNGIAFRGELYRRLGGSGVSVRRSEGCGN